MLVLAIMFSKLCLARLICVHCTYSQVWAEVLLEGSWVHVDPCEAAVNEPFIYESWGKKPTYVLAYTVDSVCDVTHCYVKDAAVVQDRRIAENVTATEFNRLLLEAQAKLQQD